MVDNSMSVYVHQLTNVPFWGEMLRAGEALRMWGQGVYVNSDFPLDSAVNLKLL